MSWATGNTKELKTQITKRAAGKQNKEGRWACVYTHKKGKCKGKILGYLFWARGKKIFSFLEFNVCSYIFLVQNKFGLKKFTIRSNKFAKPQIVLDVKSQDDRSSGQGLKIR